MRPAFPFVRDLAGLRETRFDLLVVGGGIYGAWAALDAAQRGLQVALIEQHDWGAGTSQSSSKLIHGGLRYLEHFEFRLVRHSLHERRVLHRLAPHLVRPLDFLLPVFRGGRVGPFRLSCGLTLYDLMGGFSQPVRRHRYYRRRALLEKAPFMDAEGLVGGFRYGDCQEDDARMTLVVAAAAHAQGAVCANRVRALRLDGDGAEVEAETGRFPIRARAVINAAGPWALRLLGAEAPAARLVKGMHLVMPGIPGMRKAFLLTAADGRVFFVIPWHGRTVVGTTEQVIERVEDARPTEAETDYLLAAVARALPGLGWTREHIVSRFAGTRTLDAAPAASLAAVSREFRILEPRPGVFMPLGGKYTTARCDAVEVVDRIAQRLGLARASTSHEQPLPGAPSGDYARWRGSAVAQLIAAGVDAEAALTAAQRHGTRVAEVLDRIETDRALGARVHPAAPFLRAEVALAREQEMAQDEEDVFRRRMPLALIAGSG
jgi:glycerol-3-phosphate dehydrogenase